MKIFKNLLGTRARLFSSAGFLAVVLIASVVPSTAHAQRFGRGFGRGFGGGLGWGLGFGIGSALVYNNAYSYGYGYPGVVYTAAPPTVYYVAQPTEPQTIVVNSTPAPAAAPVAQVAAPAPAVVSPSSSSAGKMSKIVYDSNGKPLGVLILNADGSQQFVPLAQ